MDEDKAFVFAEKIRTYIENLAYKSDSIEIKITISLGISQIREEDEDLDSIIIRADKALYRAKKSNRNNTVIYS